MNPINNGTAPAARDALFRQLAQDDVRQIDGILTSLCDALETRPAAAPAVAQKLDALVSLHREAKLGSSTRATRLRALAAESSHLSRHPDGGPGAIPMTVPRPEVQKVIDAYGREQSVVRQDFGFSLAVGLPMHLWLSVGKRTTPYGPPRRIFGYGGSLGQSIGLGAMVTTSRLGSRTVKPGPTQEVRFDGRDPRSGSRVPWDNRGLLAAGLGGHHSNGGDHQPTNGWVASGVHVGAGWIGEPARKLTIRAVGKTDLARVREALGIRHTPDMLGRSAVASTTPLTPAPSYHTIAPLSPAPSYTTLPASPAPSHHAL